MTPSRTVLFVCAHGAYRSRLAAAFFNAAAPAGWRATSAGVEPQAAISALAVDLAAGTAAESQLERGRPMALADAGSRDRTVAIDCAVADSERWDLAVTDVGPAQRDEIRARAEALAAQLSAG
jgi:protein-tyrosine-phosphatase